MVCGEAAGIGIILSITLRKKAINVILQPSGIMILILKTHHTPEAKEHFMKEEKVRTIP